MEVVAGEGEVGSQSNRRRRSKASACPLPLRPRLSDGWEGEEGCRMAQQARWTLVAGLSLRKEWGAGGDRRGMRQ